MLNKLRVWILGPMTDMVNGKQSMLVAISGGAYSGDLVAYGLS